MWVDGWSSKEKDDSIGIFGSVGCPVNWPISPIIWYEGIPIVKYLLLAQYILRNKSDYVLSPPWEEHVGYCNVGCIYLSTFNKDWWCKWLIFCHWSEACRQLNIEWRRRLSSEHAGHLSLIRVSRKPRRPPWSPDRGQSLWLWIIYNTAWCLDSTM